MLRHDILRCLLDREAGGRQKRHYCLVLVIHGAAIPEGLSMLQTLHDLTGQELLRRCWLLLIGDSSQVQHIVCVIDQLHF
jgi:hypothetical protein